MIYLFVYTLSRSALGKAPEIEIITTVSSPGPLTGVTVSLLSDFTLPTERSGRMWGCFRGVPGDSCPEPFLPPDPFHECRPHSFLALPESVRTLPIATNRKMHELASPKGEFIIRRQGCFMHFKSWEAARLQTLEL